MRIFTEDVLHVVVKCLPSETSFLAAHHMEGLKRALEASAGGGQLKAHLQETTLKLTTCVKLFRT